MVRLYPHQEEALKKMKNGCVLCGGTGSGKSITAISYFKKTYGAKLDRLYIITTAKKRDDGDWERELAPFSFSKKFKFTVDSWNNITKYSDIKDSYFIFDEQRVCGRGVWVKTFLRITRSNKWILLSATPGDTWIDYVPLFIANGFYRNRSDFNDQHVVYDRFARFPKVSRYLNERKLLKQKNDILVGMDFDRKTVKHQIDVFVNYDIPTYRTIGKKRWDPYKNAPIRNAAELCYLWRKVANTSPERIEAVKDILDGHPKAIVFYNFDYELESLRKFFREEKIPFSEWNGHNHQPICEGDRWVYLVQYSAGAEGWNCIETDTVIFFSQNYSYKVLTQAQGRIDRLNTPFTDLYYYHIRSRAPIDMAIRRALVNKKDFNERSYKRYFEERKSQ